MKKSVIIIWILAVTLILIFIVLHIFTIYFIYNYVGNMKMVVNKIDKGVVPSCDVASISELDESELGVGFGNPRAPQDGESLYNSYIPTCSGVCKLIDWEYGSCLFAINENGIIDGCNEFTISSTESKTQCVCCN